MQSGGSGTLRPPTPVPYGGSRGTGLSVVLNYCLPGQGGRRPPPAPGSCRWPQHVPQTALPLWGLPGATCPGPHPIVWPTRLPESPQVHSPTVPWMAAQPWREQTPGQNLPALFRPPEPADHLSFLPLPPGPPPSLTPFLGPLPPPPVTAPPLVATSHPSAGTRLLPGRPFVPPPLPRAECECCLFPC